MSGAPRNPRIAAVKADPESDAPDAQAPLRLGPLAPLWRDAQITEIMVNGPRSVIVARAGKLLASTVQFESVAELTACLSSLAAAAGVPWDANDPVADFALPDGSRAHLVGPPLTVESPSLTIRRFPDRRLKLEDLVSSGMIDQRIAYFLNAVVLGRRNLLVAGGTDSGKTTLLAALAAYIPKAERIVVIEDVPELAIAHPNRVRLQTRARFDARELVAGALRMRPDRILVGECRRGEALDMLQAMNTGHAGSMTTLHANSPRDALMRLETLCLMGGSDLPLEAIRRQIAGALDLVIQLKRSRDGHRRVVQVSEVTGLESGVITLQDVFGWVPEAGGSDTGRHRPTGLVPTFMAELEEAGVQIPAGFFAAE